MTAVLPAVSLTPATSVTTPQISASKGSDVSVSVEHKLVEYITRLQVNGHMGQEFLNPAALGSEALKMLKGYMTRSANLGQEFAVGKGYSMGNAAGQMQNNKNGAMQQTAMARGPAHSPLQPRGAVKTVEGLEAGAQAVGAADMDRAIQMLSKMLSFGLETSFIGTATTNVSKSINTLMRGQ